MFVITEILQQLFGTIQEHTNESSHATIERWQTMIAFTNKTIRDVMLSAYWPNAIYSSNHLEQVEIVEIVIDGWSSH